ALRQPLAGGRGFREAVALEERDAFEVIGQDAGRQHPGQAAADDHGVMAPRDSGETRRAAMRSSIQCSHTILLPRSEPGLETDARSAGGVGQRLPDRSAPTGAATPTRLAHEEW